MGCGCASCFEPQTGRWRTDSYPDGTVEVVPVRDAVGHEASDDCPCGPRQEPVKRKDGSMGWMAVHHSIDGREKSEAAS